MEGLELVDEVVRLRFQMVRAQEPVAEPRLAKGPEAVRGQSGQHGEVAGADRSALSDEQPSHLVTVGCRPVVEPPARIGLDPRGRVQVEDHPSGHGLAPPGLPKDEPILEIERQRGAQPDPGEPLVAWLELAVHRAELEADVSFGGARGELVRAPRRQGMIQAADRPDQALEGAGRLPLPREHQDVSSLELVSRYPRQVDRNPGYGPCLLEPALVRLETPDPRAMARR